MGFYAARLSCLLAVSASVTAVAAAPARMAPWADWRTLATAHYRIHYPPALADWAGEVAGRIETIHERVVALVGYRFPGTIQVVLADPVAEANGLAVPLLTDPHVVLWRTEPTSEAILGTFPAHWSEVLLAHELTHIHHLTWPPRPGLEGARRWLRLPLGPVFLKAPRWVSEGYATLVEGRVTGSGRPHSALRAAVLRQWARAGKLPAYGDLDGERGFLGGAMAYLVGSAYLEWLERQRPDTPDVLQRLWQQLASRRHASFQAAFRATFGFEPRDGYQRFQAETGHDALEWEARLRAQGLREGALWARMEGGVSGLGVNPDGTRLLARLGEPGKAGLAVWDLTASPAKATTAGPTHGVADAPPEFPAPVQAARLPSLDHQVPQEPFWLDNHTIGFRIKRPDREGTLRPVPGWWRLPQGSAPESLRLDGPEPPGEPAAPQVLPVRRQGRWALDWDGQEVPLPGPPAGRAWVDLPHGVVYAACDLDGFWNLVRVSFQGDAGRRSFGPAELLTRTAGAAWNPAPTPDGRWLFYTGLDARGIEIRKLDLGLPPLAGAGPLPPPRLLTPATLAPTPGPALPPVPDPVPAPVPYRAAANLWTLPAAGLSLTPSGSSVQVGLAGSDLLGRLSWQAMIGLGDAAGPRGGTLSVASSAWAWQPSASLFTALERPSRQRLAPAAADRERRGGEVMALYADQGPTPFWISPVAAWERVWPQDLTPVQRGLAGLRAGVRLLRARGGWGVDLAPSGQVYQGATGGQAWRAWRGAVRLRLETPLAPVTVLGERGALAGNPNEIFTLGGVTGVLAPASLDLNRVAQPALPARTATGDRFLRWRGELGGTVHLYAEGAALWTAGGDRGPFQRVLGLEATLDRRAFPGGETLFRRVRVEAGVHRPLDGAMAGRTVATVTVLVRP